MHRESQTENPERLCPKCAQMRTPDGHDPCIANLSNVMNACCGHGDDVDAYVQFKNGKCIRGNLALIYQRIKILRGLMSILYNSVPPPADIRCGKDLFDRGYRTTSNKYKLANVCPLTDAKLVEWALTSGKCGHLLAHFRDIYRRSMPGTLELIPEQFAELKEAQHAG